MALGKNELEELVWRLVEDFELHRPPFDQLEYESDTDTAKSRARDAKRPWTEELQAALILKTQGMAFWAEAYQFHDDAIDDILSQCGLLYSPPISPQVWNDMSSILRPQVMRAAVRNVLARECPNLQFDRAIARKTRSACGQYLWFRFSDHPLLALGVDVPILHSGAAYLDLLDIKHDIVIHLSALFGAGNIGNARSEIDVKEQFMRAWPYAITLCDAYASAVEQDTVD